jgi:hypothetical protein
MKQEGMLNILVCWFIYDSIQRERGKQIITGVNISIDSRWIQVLRNHNKFGAQISFSTLVLGFQCPIRCPANWVESSVTLKIHSNNPIIHKHQFRVENHVSANEESQLL